MIPSKVTADTSSLDQTPTTDLSCPAVTFEGIETYYTIPQIIKQFPFGITDEDLRAACDRKFDRIKHIRTGPNQGKRMIRLSALIEWLNEEEERNARG